MTLTITVTDEQTGEQETKRIEEGDFCLVVHEPCYFASGWNYENGTAVLTIKGYRFSTHRPPSGDEAGK